MHQTAKKTLSSTCNHLTVRCSRKNHHEISHSTEPRPPSNLRRQRRTSPNVAPPLTPPDRRPGSGGAERQFPAILRDAEGSDIHGRRTRCHVRTAYKLSRRQAWRDRRMSLRRPPDRRRQSFGRYHHHYLNLEVEAALSVACGRPLTLKE